MSIYSLKERRLQKSLNELSRTCSVLKKRLSGLLKNSVRAMLAALEVRDAYTHGHVVRGSLYALMLGRALKLPREKLIQLELGALLHDIGKIGIPDHILFKPGPLTREEYEIMKRHPMISAKIIASIGSLKPVVPVVRHHQERIDGKGYPDGLKDGEIPLLARIIYISDAFDAMTTDRPYRKAMSEKSALEELERHAGTQFDAKLTSLFIREYKRKKHLPYHSEFFPEKKSKQAIGE